MKKLLIILTTFICLLPFRAFSMERIAVRYASEYMKEFTNEVFKEYGLNPKEYQVFLYSDPSDEAGAAFNDAAQKRVFINAAKFPKSLDDFDVTDLDNWNKIYIIYHEIGHLADKEKSKTMQERELIADRLATEQLLKKDWGMGPICAKLFNLQIGIAKGSEFDWKKIGHDDPKIEFENIVKILDRHGFSVKVTKPINFNPKDPELVVVIRNKDTGKIIQTLTTFDVNNLENPFFDIPAYPNWYHKF